MQILYSPDQVNKRIQQMAAEIITRYNTDKPLFVCLLKGAVPFTSKIVTAITRLDPGFYPEVEYVHISAYGEEREAGTATIYSGLSEEVVHGRSIIVLDDCLDQGITYTEAKDYLLGQGAESVQLVVLANKDTQRKLNEEPLITGFHTPDVWLVGMGMDDSQTALEAQRWAEYIGSVS